MLQNGDSIKFWHDIWMVESPFIEKISQECKSRIKETTKFSYFIDDNKTWNIWKVIELLSKYIVEKINSIPIPMNDIRIKLYENLPIMKKI